MKMVWSDGKLAGKHYTKDISDRHGEKVRDSLLEYIRKGPVVAIVLEGIGAIEVVRKLCGATYPGEAVPGTIRGDFCHASKAYVKNGNKGYNVVHSSASPEEAKTEISLWFKEGELHSYKTVNEEFVF
jgi:nucleoside-diphosphate kinase